MAASAGCGGAIQESGERALSVEGRERAYIASVPKAYDQKTPYPVVFGFHGKHRSHEQCRDVDCRGLHESFSEQAIMVYMKSLGAGWYEPGRAFLDNDPFFDAALERIMGEFCVDKSRVVVAGGSSGGFFANHLACTRGNQQLASIAVGGGPGAPEGTKCQAPVAALVVHGVDDPHVPFPKGEAARDAFLKRNGCTANTVPPLLEVHAKVRRERDSGQETYGCVNYQGCRQGLLVQWCEHGEGGYDGSTHGWPTFGGEMIQDFLRQL
jgi:poly(3-hydroxybutyrate) depolymerase